MPDLKNDSIIYLKSCERKVSAMTNVVEKEIFCRECGKGSVTELYPTVRVSDETELRQKVFDGSLTLWECPECGAQTRLSYPLLYSDIKRGFLIYLIPHTEKFCTVDEALESLYPELAHLRRRTVPTFSALKEKIYCFENGLDDMALELAKLAVSRTVADRFGVKRVGEGYLSMYDLENNTIGFTFFVGQNKEPYLQSARLELYSKSIRIVNEIAAKDRKKSGFLKIDREWADNIIYRYNASKK